MRVSTAAFFIIVSGNLFATEQSQQQDANVQCVERLRIPAYPGIAVSARLYGDVDATVQVGPGGVVRDAVLAGKPHSLLANAVLDAIRGLHVQTHLRRPQRLTVIPLSDRG